MQPNQVINQLIARFETLFPRLAFRSLRRLPPPARGEIPYHIVLRVTLPTVVECDLGCMVLQTGYREEVERAIHRLATWQAAGATSTFVSTILAPRLQVSERELVRNSALCYLDLEGNMSLDIPGTYIFIDRNGGPKSTVAERVVQPFDGKAERIARRLMLAPGKTWSMRELAAACDVSLGMASMTTTALEGMGVFKSRRGVSVADPVALLEAWVAAYQVNRNPFQVLRATISGFSMQDLVKFKSTEWALTLWSGAALLLGETLPIERIALYWAGDVAKLTERMKLKHDNGDKQVIVFQPRDTSQLWESRAYHGGIRVVNPLQLYLDLASGDEGEIQLARRVRSGYLPW